jgi:hypothetical protein
MARLTASRPASIRARRNGKPVKGLWTSANGTQPHHRRETFLYSLKAGPAGGSEAGPTGEETPAAPRSWVKGPRGRRGS